MANKPYARPQTRHATPTEITRAEVAIRKAVSDVDSTIPRNNLSTFDLADWLLKRGIKHVR